MSVRAKLYCGDNKKSLNLLKENSVDSIVTDPPYGLSKAPDTVVMLKAWLESTTYHHKSKGFMQKEWDSFVPQPDFWKEAIRVLKPGGYCIAFFGTRTYDLGVLAMRLAGFEILNQVAWVYGSGFCKGLDISKQIDKKLRKKRTKIKIKSRADTSGSLAGKAETRPFIEKAKLKGCHEFDSNIPVSELAQKWQGWRTGLKPAMEPIVIARKPFKGNYVDNILKYGVGAFNIDACRIGNEKLKAQIDGQSKIETFKKDSILVTEVREGRFPSNFIHDGSDEVLNLFPYSKSGATKDRIQKESKNIAMSGKNYKRFIKAIPADEGSVARFFYCAKTSKADRDEYMTTKEKAHVSFFISEGRTTSYKNFHPTLKPEALMRYLCRLVTPPNGIVLDPFMGSGSTGKACMKERFRFIGMEMELDYFKIAYTRVSANGIIPVKRIRVK